MDLLPLCDISGDRGPATFVSYHDRDLLCVYIMSGNREAVIFVCHIIRDLLHLYVMSANKGPATSVTYKGIRDLLHVSHVKR